MTGKTCWRAALGAGVLVAATVVPALGRQVHENSGRLCFETTPDGATIVEHRLDGCFSSSCTDVPEKTLIASVTQVPPVVRVLVMVMTAPSGAIVCNTDCNFVPRMDFDLGVVPAETYLVYLGDRAIGAWVPVPGAEPTCLHAG